MNYSVFLAFLISTTVCLNTVAQVLLKSGSDKPLLNIHLLGGVIVYGLSTLMYISVLGKLNLSLAYPLIIGLTVIATTFSGVYFFEEKVAPIAWVGIGLVLSGIWAIALGRG